MLGPIVGVRPVEGAAVGADVVGTVVVCAEVADTPAWGPLPDGSVPLLVTATTTPLAARSTASETKGRSTGTGGRPSNPVWSPAWAVIPSRTYRCPRASAKSRTTPTPPVTSTSVNDIDEATSCCTSEPMNPIAPVTSSAHMTTPRTAHELLSGAHARTEPASTTATTVAGTGSALR